MRKSLICLALAASVVSVNIQAQVQDENAAGPNAQNLPFGGVNPALVGAGIVAGTIAAGLIHNSDGISPERKVKPDPKPDPDPDPTCSAGDDLVDGICISTTVTATNTVTATGTGTNTSTTSVTYTVASTYLPTN